MTGENIQAVGRAALPGAIGMAALAATVCALMGAWLEVTAILIILAVVVALGTLLLRHAELEVEPQNEIPRPAAKDPRDEWGP